MFKINILNKEGFLCQTKNGKKLTRSTRDCKFAGVCGGLGEYLNISSTIIRIAFFILIFFKSIGFWLYLFFWLLLPTDDEA